MVDELLVASAADAFTAEFISVSPFTVLVSIFPSAELKPIRGLISDRLTRRLFGILAWRYSIIMFEVNPLKHRACIC